MIITIADASVRVPHWKFSNSDAQPIEFTAVHKSEGGCPPVPIMNHIRPLKTRPLALAEEFLGVGAHFAEHDRVENHVAASALSWADYSLLASKRFLLHSNSGPRRISPEDRNLHLVLLDEHMRAASLIDTSRNWTLESARCRWKRTRHIAGDVKVPVLVRNLGGNYSRRRSKVCKRTQVLRNSRQSER